MDKKKTSNTIPREDIKRISPIHSALIPDEFFISFFLWGKSDLGGWCIVFGRERGGNSRMNLWRRLGGGNLQIHFLWGWWLLLSPRLIRFETNFTHQFPHSPIVTIIRSNYKWFFNCRSIMILVSGSLLVFNKLSDYCILWKKLRFHLFHIAISDQIDNSRLRGWAKGPP